MSKSKSKSARNKASSRPGRARPRMRASASKYNPLADIRVAKWDACLRDPCGAELAHPCYAGTDQGYLIRTVETQGVFYNGTFTVGQSGSLDGVYQYTPGSTYSGNGVLYWYNARDQIGNLAKAAPGVGVLSQASVVEQYRPVAACLRWVPNGPYGSRAGSVGLGYSPSQQYQNNDSVSALGALRQCSEIATNGAPRRDAPGHEVRWLPGANDGGWISFDGTSNPAGTASLFMVLSGIDATATTTTKMVANGYIELVTIWEWTPAISTQATAAPRAPIPYTTQEVLATIGDMGSYLFAGVRKSGPGIIRAAVNEGMRYLTGGYGGSRTRGATYLTY